MLCCVYILVLIHRCTFKELKKPAKCLHLCAEVLERPIQFICAAFIRLATVDYNNSQWVFVLIEFFSRTQKNLAIKIVLYSPVRRRKVFKVLWCSVMSFYLNYHWWQTHKALWGHIVMKCQSCHFLSCNYRLACSPSMIIYRTASSGLLRTWKTHTYLCHISLLFSLLLFTSDM